MENTPNTPRTNPEQPTRATDPQESEISGNVFDAIGKALRPDPEEEQQVRREEPLEDTPQTSSE